MNHKLSSSMFFIKKIIVFDFLKSKYTFSCFLYLRKVHCYIHIGIQLKYKEYPFFTLCLSHWFICNHETTFKGNLP